MLSDVERRGLLLGTGGTARRAARFDGLIRDGVARVHATFRGGVVRSVAVRDNVVSFRVPTRDAFPFPRRIAWLAADGSRVRVVRFP